MDRDMFLDTLLDDNTDIFTIPEGDMELFSNMFPEQAEAHEAMQNAFNTAPLAWPQLSSPQQVSDSASFLQLLNVPKSHNSSNFPLQGSGELQQNFEGQKTSGAQEIRPKSEASSSNDSSRSGRHGQVSQASEPIELASMPHPYFRMGPDASTCAIAGDEYPEQMRVGLTGRQRSKSLRDLAPNETTSFEPNKARKRMPINPIQGSKPNQMASAKPKKPSSAASLAQKKYMDRKKMKDAETERQVIELTRSLEVLMREKKELEMKERVNRDALDGVQPHMDRLFAHKVVREYQQLNILKKKADFQSMLEGRTIDVDEIKNWTIKQYASHYFQPYFERLRGLVPEVLQRPHSKAATELNILTSLHIDFSRTSAVASCFHWALLCYNLDRAQKLIQEGRNGLNYAKLLATLDLTEDQKVRLLQARDVLLNTVAQIASERRTIFSALGLQSLAFPKEQMHKCPAAMSLYNSLKDESTAVLGFNMNVEGILTPAQDALLEIESIPWCPNLVSLVDMLAAERYPHSAHVPRSEGFTRMVGDIPIMPKFTAYEILTMPMTGYGCGKILRSCIILCNSSCVLSAFSAPMPIVETVESMTLLGACLGCWRKYTCWQWLAQVKERGSLFENPLFRNEAEAQLHQDLEPLNGFPLQQA